MVSPDAGTGHILGMGFVGGSDKYPIFKEYISPFVGLDQEATKSLESRLKGDYEVRDYKTKHGDKPGYEVINKRTSERYVFSPNARLVLETRYLEKDERKNPVEDVLDLFTRVAVNIATADLKYDSSTDVYKTADEFLSIMLNHEFLPNTPTLCNAGRPLQQLSACFVLPVDDYVATDDIGEDPEKQGNGIYDTGRNMAMIHKSGGGTGFNFSRLRPKMDMICTTFGSSSGPVSFIESLDGITDAINQGGFRRGANMGILYYSHPDIFEFVHKKTTPGKLVNFNLSVGVDNDFMEKVRNSGYFTLINPKNQRTVPLEQRVYKSYNLFQQKRYEGELTKQQKKEKDEYERRLKEFKPSLLLSENGREVILAYTNQAVGKIGEQEEVLISAKALFNYIAESAWKTGCPGIIFLDRINWDNPTPHISKIESTNPCGEQPLLPYEACNLGSINLDKCVVDGKFDYSKLEKLVRTSVHFLDNVIDMSKFPFKKIHIMAKGNRKIGLGVMGFADLLYTFGISYDSEEAIKLGSEIMKYITETARDESEKLGETRGVFPNWQGSVYDPDSEFCKEDRRGNKPRNALVTTIAPTGTISMILDASGGIEPTFDLFFDKVCMDERRLVYRNEKLEKKLEEKGINPDDVFNQMLVSSSIQKLDVSEDIKRIFKTAHDIPFEWHVRMQAAFQKDTDNAVSKTVNMPHEATVGDVRKVYMWAYEMGCKGITIYRDMSKETQVLQKKEGPKPGGLEKEVGTEAGPGRIIKYKSLRRDL